MSVAEADTTQANATTEGRSALEARDPMRKADQPKTDQPKTDHPKADQAVARDKPDDDAAEKNSEPGSGFRAAFRKHPIALLVCAFLLVAGIVASIAWYLNTRHFETTDDAFIDGRPVLISPQVTGSIIAVNVTDNQLVKAGDLLAKIDPRDYQAAVDQADAQVRQAEAAVQNLDAQLREQDAQIEQTTKQGAGAKAALNFAQDENNRYQDLVQKGAGTLQRAQQATSDLDSRRASLDAANAAEIAAKRRVAVLQAQRASAVAQIDQMKAQKAQADVNLGRTELRATVDGRIAKLSAAVGALATSAQSIMVLVPLDIWVTANFKESQLADMKIGQPVDISIDAYHRTFRGRVDGVQAGSGTAFSLLPAENATGNYVKIVQRVPVKIKFDQKPDVGLGPGMSVVPTVTVRP